jgi:DNA-directed RNA polymerase subunit K/omega
MAALKDYIVNPVEIRHEVSTDETSIYEAIGAMGFRARQINDDIKAQLHARMKHIDPLEDETEFGNFDQLQISKEFDRISKPTFLAMKEIQDGNLDFRLDRPVSHMSVDETVEKKPRRKTK